MEYNDLLDWSDERFYAWLGRQGSLYHILQGLRELEHLVLRQVHELTTISPTHIYRLEHGMRYPKRDWLIVLLLKGYDLPVPWTNRVLRIAGYAPLGGKWDIPEYNPDPPSEPDGPDE